VTKTYRIRKEGGGGGVRLVAEKENPRAYEKFPSRHPLGSAVSVIMEFQVPSNKQSPIGVIDFILILILDTKSESKKESEELESRRVGRDNDFRMVRQMVKESGSKRVDALSQMNFATWSRSMQPSAHEAVPWGLQTIFLKLQTLLA
jgi:hypothetical protein